MACYVHRLPGRVRVQSASIRRSPARAENVRRQLAALPGVSSVRLNAAAGSLTVLHDAQAQSGDGILGVFQAAGFEVSAAARPGDEGGVVAMRAARAGNSFGKAVFDVVLAKTIERSVTVLVAAVFRGV